MKKSNQVFLIVGLVIISSVAWFISINKVTNLLENLHFIVILLLVLFALFIGYKRLTSERRGEPTEDEMSKKVVQKAAAISYFISLYLWVAIIYVKDRVEVDTEVLIGSGILGMAVIFALSWIVLNFMGLRNE